MIDFRSDTVTRPTKAMRTAMGEAEVGDDVYRDDPTVNAFEARVAALLGKEAAVFVPSGTQSNLIGLLAHCQRGEEYIVGQTAHTYRYEGGGAAVLGSIQPQPIEMAADGTLPLDEVAARIKPVDSHFAQTKLLAVENTHDGKVLPSSYMDALRPFADEHGLNLHLDGARLWNAIVESGRSPVEIAAPFDTVSVCFSKGLGAPVGSALVGRADLVSEARRWRKMVGGGLRQAGIIAAGAAYAIDNHIDRLAEDHRRARELAAGLATIDGFHVDPVQTNMVFVHSDCDPVAWSAWLAERKIIITAGATTRLVTHLDIDDAAVATLVEATTSFGDAAIK